jgi:2-dehydropantoate 2-reductase
VRITIVGAGAMGSLLAARLAGSVGRGSPDDPDTAIDHVLLYGRPSDHLERIAADGLILTERNGTTATLNIPVSSDARDVEGSDLVIVLVKAHASAESVAPLKSVLNRETVVLTLQNGLGNASALRSALLNDGVRPHVWLGVTTQAAIRTAPGEVTHTGDGITAIGRRTSSANTRIRTTANALTAANWSTVAVDDIHRWVWRKLAVNAAINPLTALGGVQNGAIASDPALRLAATTLASEVVAVAQAHKVTIDRNEVLAAVDEVARATGENRSSMLVDLEQGERTEIDAINGAVISEANRVGIKVPANQLVTALIRAREGRGSSTRDTDDADIAATEVN